MTTQCSRCGDGAPTDPLCPRCDAALWSIREARAASVRARDAWRSARSRIEALRRVADDLERELGEIPDGGETSAALVSAVVDCAERRAS